MLMITCIFPRLWDSWFSKTFEQSVIDRVAQEILHLEPFGPKHGVSLLAIRMGPWFSKHHLPTNIYPFELHDANRFHEAGGSIRAFLRTANRSLQSWLIGTEIEPIVYEGPTVVTSGMLDDVLKSFMNRIEQEQREAHQSTIPIEHDLFGRVQNILRVLVKSCPESVDFGNAENGSRVMPSNVIISSWTLTPIRPFRSCIAVLNGSGNSFTACIGNLLEVFRGGIGFSTAILLRDARSKAPGAVGRERLTSFEQVNGVVIRLDRDELAVLNAIYETLVEIEEEGITVANTPVTTEQFVGYLRSSCVVVRSKLFQTLAQHFPPLHQVLYPPNASPGT